MVRVWAKRNCPAASIAHFDRLEWLQRQQRISYCLEFFICDDLSPVDHLSCFHNVTADSNAFDGGPIFRARKVAGEVYRSRDIDLQRVLWLPPPHLGLAGLGAQNFSPLFQMQKCIRHDFSSYP